MATVAHLVLRYDKGGLEMTALNLSRELKRRGHRSVVIALDGGGETFDLAQSEGHECIALSGRRFASLRFHRDLRRAVASVRPDVIHSHHFSALLHSGAAAGLAARRVHTEHSRRYLTDRADYRVALRMASLGVDRFVVVGQSMRDQYRDVVGIASHRLQVIVNGVDTRSFRPVSADERSVVRRELGLAGGPTIGSVGRLADVKNFAMLIRAVAAARGAAPNLELVLVGDGPERQSLESIATAVGIRDRVRFAGWQRDARPWLQALDVFALSSATEALPLALLEAMACGLPVLATTVGDVTGIVRDAECGILVPPTDEAGFTGGLGQLLQSDLGALGLAARQAAEREYSLDRMVDEYFRAYGIRP